MITRLRGRTPHATLFVVIAALLAHVDVVTRALAERLQRLKANRRGGLSLYDAWSLSAFSVRPIMGASDATTLDAAAAELDALVSKSAGDPPKPAERTLMEQLRDLIGRGTALLNKSDEGKHEDGDDAGDGMIWLSGKKVKKPKEGTRVEPDKDDIDGKSGPEKSRTSATATAEAINKSITEIPGAVDASPVLDALVKALTEGFTRMAAQQDAMRKSYEERLETLQKAVDAQGGALAVLAKSEMHLIKSVEALPVRPVSPGFLGMIEGKQIQVGGSRAGEGALSKSEITERVERAVSEGKVEPHVLAILDSDLHRALSLIDNDVAKSFGIPRPAPKS